jgi:DNA-binding beta-propeller fold protein YncE
MTSTHQNRLATLLTAVGLSGLAATGCGGKEDGAEPDDSALVACPRQSGNICTIAGTGIAGDGADQLRPRETRLYLPQDTTVGPDGRLFVVDWNNHRIRVLDPDGVMRIVAGEGELGLNADDPSTDRLNHPTGVAFNPVGLPGEMAIAAWHNSRVKTVDLATKQVVDTCGNGKRGFAGNGGPAATATLDLPVGIAFTPAGDMLIADQANQMIRAVNHETGVIETIAGLGHCADAINPDPCVLNDGGPAVSAGFHFPIGQAAQPGGRIALDAAGNIYIADTGNFRVRRIDPAGMIDTFAGTGTWGFEGDGGPARDAQLGRVADVAVGSDGSVYIADTDNSCVRVVSPAGVISTFAGRCGQSGFAGNASPATEALLDRPYGVEVAPTGDVYIADTHNQRIRMVFH